MRTEDVYNVVGGEVNDLLSDIEKLQSENKQLQEAIIEILNICEDTPEGEDAEILDTAINEIYYTVKDVYHICDKPKVIDDDQLWKEV